MLSQIKGYASRHAGVLHTPTETGNLHHPSMAKWPTAGPWQVIANPEVLSTPTKLPTPVKNDRKMEPWSEAYARRRSPKLDALLDGASKFETLPTPTKRDSRMDRWSPAYDKRKSPTMDAVLDGAMTDRAPDKWAYARQIASLLAGAGLSGPSKTLPITYGWMMGFPPGWLTRALRRAVASGRLPRA
ncbi:hypothetical protein FHS82_001024 [Pseudochelatococcus lubricantis]|uniref:Uncharacterized protein n=1 Tax=Pseudochelatococcus lubricantis TaxID=1538102 RepID=A0ABX0UW69_9HYPH|nr:hypothetical protein [Pseudochelatococcus lubricantis]NIJ57198.1 hypothetical protein [Pseudochelatococcus lubricantis]